MLVYINYTSKLLVFPYDICNLMLSCKILLYNISDLVLNHEILLDNIVKSNEIVYNIFVF